MLVLIVIPPLAGVIVGYLLGGRLSGLRTIRLVAIWLLWLAAFVQAAQYYLPGARDFVEIRVGVPPLVVVFAPVLIWLGVNLRNWPAAIRVAGAVIALGAVLNGIAIAVNGRMPYSPAMAESVGLRPGLTTPKNAPVDADTRLSFLGDTIPIAPLRKVISPGDVLISGGSCAVVVLAMRRHRRELPVAQLTQTRTGGES
ncbi:DUF5317 family protein [Dactylosporangium sp. NPDC000555]|uniref:DUF5317 family protein n=1 Tax=unclassified Dactylosporangium TaxID=2621675 RepID=UPI0033165711